MSPQQNGSAVVATALHLLDDLGTVAAALESSSESVLARAFPDSDPGLGGRAIVGATTGLESAARDDVVSGALKEERRRVLEAGARAVGRVRDEGESVQLTPEEQSGLEAIVLFTARPALLLHEGEYGQAPPPWDEKLEGYRQDISRTALSVGRIQLPGLPQVPYGGTGFLVAPDVIMTNCHVARIFADLGPDQTWTFQEHVGACVDFVDDPDAPDVHRELLVEGVIGVHDRLDLALLRVKPSDGDGFGEPVKLASEDPGDLQGRSVYVVGYPAPDPRNDPVIQRTVFGDRYYVKRLQPGAIMAAPAGVQIRSQHCSPGAEEGEVIFHDASTLGGNSGSCVMDLENGQVIGLHFGGRYMEFNQAVALWTLVDDPLLAGAGLNWD
jgi:hypothetical protein